MEDKTEPKIPEMTPEQKAVMEKVKQNISKFSRMIPFYLFNQLQMIEDGEIRIFLTITDHQIGNIEFHSSFARDVTDNGEKD